MNQRFFSLSNPLTLNYFTLPIRNVEIYQALQPAFIGPGEPRGLLLAFAFDCYYWLGLVPMYRYPPCPGRMMEDDIDDDDDDTMYQNTYVAENKIPRLSYFLQLFEAGHNFLTFILKWKRIYTISVSFPTSTEPELVRAKSENKTLKEEGLYVASKLAPMPAHPQVKCVLH